MAEIIQTITSIYRSYSGSSIFMLLVLIALLYLWITEDKKDTVTVLVYLVTGLFALFFIPFYAYVIIHFILEEEVYYRMLWLVPTACIFAYAAVRALIRTQGLFRRGVVAFLLICFLAEAAVVSLRMERIRRLRMHIMCRRQWLTSWQS